MTDRRIPRTRLALRNALLTLLPQRSWDELSVQDLCEQANVGRSTFYLHFQGKEDLLVASLNDLRLALGANQASTDLSPPPLGFLSGLLAHMEEQRAVFKAVIGRRGSQLVERRFREMVFQLVESDLARSTLHEPERVMTAVAISGALVDLMVWWVDAAEEVGSVQLQNFMRRWVLNQHPVIGTPSTLSAGTRCQPAAPGVGRLA